MTVLFESVYVTGVSVRGYVGVPRPLVHILTVDLTVV